jgi:4-diphosphocytidyl-2-C-methyl-D-erythritol kinase
MADVPKERVVLAARAKINLGLEVLGRRPDGYHEIRTLMQSIALADRIEFTLLAGRRLRLVCPDGTLPEGEGNLAFRAAVLLRDHRRVRQGARIVLHKRIPIGAGLGGGSSDAAATLVGLNRIWKLRLPVETLAELGARLGADVPFFLRGGTQLAEGIGERLTPWPALPRLPVVVVFPNLFVPTGSIYEALKFPLTVHGPLARLHRRNSATYSDIVSYVARLRNDLEPTVAGRYRKVADLLRRFRGECLDVVRVSGSGSSLFLICNDKEVLRMALGTAAMRDCQVFQTWFAKRGWHFVGSRGAGSDNRMH